MAEFKVGDKVVRKENLIYGGWELDCARNDRSVSEVFTVSGTWGSLIAVDGIPGHWNEECFRLATGLEERQDSTLPAEDRLRESDAHIECLRELLDIEKRKVDELQAEVARCCGTVANKADMEEKIANLLKLNNDLSDRVCDLIEQLHDVTDQRDAATTAAKSLGDEVQKLREDRRMWRMTAAEWDGLFMALSAGVEDIDLGQLVTQLDQIGRMADEQGNGADAKLCFDASQVVAMVVRTLDSLLDE